jgi:hypothetical protein
MKIGGLGDIVSVAALFSWQPNGKLGKRAASLALRPNEPIDPL